MMHGACACSLQEAGSRGSARQGCACCSRLLAAEHTTGWARKGLAAGLEAGRWRLGDIAAGWDRGVGYEGGGRGRSPELRRAVSMPTESKRRGKKKGVQWKDATGRADGEAPARFMDGAPFLPYVCTPQTRLSDSPATTRSSLNISLDARNVRTASIDVLNVYVERRAACLAGRAANAVPV